MTVKYNVLDLFSGAGGLTEGFIQADFNFIAHVEMNPDAAKSLQTRILFHQLRESGHLDIYRKYMKNYAAPEARSQFLLDCIEHGIDDNSVINREITFENRDEIAETIQSRLNKINGHIDIIIGGPPCQAYSMMRRWEQIQKDYQDPKGFLYQQYLYFLNKFHPRVFVFENVPGLQSMNSGKRCNDIISGLTDAGYNVDMKILHASDFGVLQERKRIIFIGWRKPEKHDFPEFEKHPSKATIRDLLLQDLPSLQAGEGEIVQEYNAKPNEYLKKSGLRAPDMDIILHHISRANSDQDREIYRYAIRAWNEGKRMRYTDLPEELQSHKNKSSFLDRFKVVNPDGYSHSVVSHLSKDGHYFIHPDINQARSITVREAARIQSFPDDYIFEGSRTSQFIQIGNAVPPLMAKGLAEKIRDMLSSSND